MSLRRQCGVGTQNVPKAPANLPRVFTHQLLRPLVEQSRSERAPIIDFDKREKERENVSSDCGELDELQSSPELENLEARHQRPFKADNLIKKLNNKWRRIVMRGSL